MVIRRRRRLDSGLTDNERLEARDGVVRPLLLSEGRGGDSFIILASEETEMHWPPESDGERQRGKKGRVPSGRD